jgi:sugar fermentation stimulation protein A
MKLQTPLLQGALVKRYRRFLADVKLMENGTIVTAHCPNSGSMVGCCEPGRSVVLSDSGDSSRRHPLTWELIEMDTAWVAVNPHLGRKIVHDALLNRQIPTLVEYSDIQKDAQSGLGRKVDFMLQGMEHNCFINLFIVTWADHGTALYPDVPSERSTKAMSALADIARQGHRAVAFFFVQRGDCSAFKPAENVDRQFRKAMVDATNAGVETIVYRAHITPEEISLGEPLSFTME